MLCITIFITGVGITATMIRSGVMSQKIGVGMMVNGCAMNRVTVLGRTGVIRMVQTGVNIMWTIAGRTELILATMTG